jgi:hypothetical protein
MFKKCSINSKGYVAFPISSISSISSPATHKSIYVTFKQVIAGLDQHSVKSNLHKWHLISSLSSLQSSLLWKMPLRSNKNDSRHESQNCHSSGRWTLLSGKGCVILYSSVKREMSRRRSGVPTQQGDTCINAAVASEPDC